MATNVSGYSFNGTSQRIILPTTLTLKNMTNFTWMCWVKLDNAANASSYKRLYVERQGTGAGIRFAATPMKDRIRFEFSPKDGRTDTNYDYKYVWDDRWHHIAFVARGIGGTSPTYDMYLDGGQVAEGTLIVPSDITAISNTTPLGGSVFLGNASFHTSGGAVYDSTRYWAGKIDELIVFNDSKTETDIITYVGSRDTWDMADTEMFSYWRFDENTGTSLTDSDNVTWTGTANTSTGWTLDRPFLGNGTLDTTLPAAPTLPATPTTAITSDGFTATWLASTDNIFVQFYELRVATLSDFSAYTAYNTKLALSKIVTGLLPSTNYYWRVVAVDAASNISAPSATQSLTTLTSGDVTAPLPPTLLVSNLVTHVSFRVSWTASASSDETGYKLDVALDPNFDTYLEGFRNIDVGNVTLYDVIGTQPLTNYYVRLRAYDAADNEGIESSTLVVQTAPLPDTTAPLVVTLLPATSIEPRAFTANWEAGIDDVGIGYYVLDVATDAGFTTFANVGNVLYQNVNVGNVLAYRITGAIPETFYYYRVRAIDTSGNMSQNPAAGIDVETPIANVDEGGYVATTTYPNADAWTDSAATTTNHGTDTTLTSAGNGSISLSNIYLRFDLSSVAGTIQSAMLRLYVLNTSVASIQVNIGTVDFDETTINWSNQPAVGATTLTFVPPAINNWASIDIGSLLVGAGIYVVRIRNISADNLIIESREGVNVPELEIESDPATATTVDTTVYVHDHANQALLTNYIRNPSGEDTTTNLWTPTGSTPATLSNVAGAAYSGTRVFQAVCSGAVANQGAQYLNTDIVAVQNQYWTGSVSVKSVNGSTALRIRVSSYTVGGALIASTTLAITAVVGEWRRFSVTRQLVDPTVARVSIGIETAGATAATFQWDAVMLRGDTLPTWWGTYFDGNTSGAFWTGTVNASTSQMGTAQFHFESSYIGDSDGDNSVLAYIKEATSNEWISLPEFATQTVNDRTTKLVTTLFGPSYAFYNYITNPNFAVDVAGWTLINPNANATLAQDIYTVDTGIGSAKLTFGAGAGSGLFSNRAPAAAGETWTARANVYIPSGITARLFVRAFTSALVALSTSTVDVGISEIVGEDDWYQMADSFVLPATTAYVDVAIIVASTIAGVLYIDSVQLQKSAFLNPYLDGDMLGGVWEGAPHNSYTSFMLKPLTEYDLRHDYTDPDGVLNNTGESTYTHIARHTTLTVPDNATTVLTLTLTPDPESLNFVATYAGDDNATSTATVEYKRTDLSGWNAVTPLYNRAAKTVSGDIVALNMGTSYTVRVTFTDSDAVYGVNPLTQTMTTTTDVGSAEAESFITFDGFVLMGRTDAKMGVSQHNAFGLPERRVQVEPLPLNDGAIELSNLWGQRVISMTGFVEGEDRGELEDNKNALKRALAPKLSQLVIDTLSNQGRFYRATCTSLAIVEGGENYRHLVWDAEFTCADPFAYDSDLTVVPEFTITNGSTSSFANIGDLRVEPLIEVRSSHTKPVTLTIVNNTTGERITPYATFKTGDSLMIDNIKKSVLKNGVEVDYIGGFLHFGVGANQLVYTLTATSGTPTALVKMSWRHKYL